MEEQLYICPMSDQCGDKCVTPSHRGRHTYKPSCNWGCPMYTGAICIPVKEVKVEEKVEIIKSCENCADYRRHDGERPCISCTSLYNKWTPKIEVETDCGTCDRYITFKDNCRRLLMKIQFPVALGFGLGLFILANIYLAKSQTLTLSIIGLAMLICSFFLIGFSVRRG
jgi:hypothetical protein